MKRGVAVLLSLVLAVTSVSAEHAWAQTADDAGRSAESQAIPAGAARLIAAYPEQKLRYEDNHIVFPDGTRLVYDDGQEKDFETMLDRSDIEDMFAMPYVTEGEPGYLQDAGRSRCEALFKKMYGGDAAAVRKTLVSVSWFGQTLKFTRVNGAADQLVRVAEELKQYPELKQYMKSSGTFNWRKVRQANRMSAHSYGMAIDIAVPQSDYWHWAYKKASETDKIGYKNRIPMEIVRIFEKHGFVWGGRWYHFDTMHFEYRPEIIQK